MVETTPNHLNFFYGTDCPHCEVMKPLFAKLFHETGLLVQEFDIWKDESAYRVFENYQKNVLLEDPECDGIPFFYNTTTKKYLCGEVSYTELKDWAMI